MIMSPMIKLCQDSLLPLIFHCFWAFGLSNLPQSTQYPICGAKIGLRLLLPNISETGFKYLAYLHVFLSPHLERHLLLAF